MKNIFSFALMIFLLTGCFNQPDLSKYKHIEKAKVIKIQKVLIRAHKPSSLGIGAGAIAGALIGKNKIRGALVGAVTGGVVSAVVGKEETAYKIYFKTNSGEIYTSLVPPPLTLKKGERVKLYFDNQNFIDYVLPY